MQNYMKGKGVKMNKRFMTECIWKNNNVKLMKGKVCNYVY